MITDDLDTNGGDSIGYRTGFWRRISMEHINVTTKKALQTEIAARRHDGWNILTYGYTRTEMEKDGMICVIEVHRKEATS